MDRSPSERDIRECNLARDYSGLTFSSPLAPFVKAVSLLGKCGKGKKGR